MLLFKKELRNFLDRMKDLHLEVVMSEYSLDEISLWHDKDVLGDIVEVAKTHDFIVNAWDPHSAEMEMMRTAL